MLTFLDEVEEMFYCDMMKAAEVLPAVHFAADLATMEQEEGRKLTEAEIAAAYYRAADRTIDAYVQNEHDTPQSEVLDDVPLAARVATWEAMRPKNIRRRQLLEQLAKLN